MAELLADLEHEAHARALERLQSLVGFGEREDLLLMVGNIHHEADHPHQLAIPEVRDPPVPQHLASLVPHQQVHAVGFLPGNGIHIALIKMQRFLRSQPGGPYQLAEREDAVIQFVELQEVAVAGQQQAIPVT
ncbi:hypothetical protein D3C78_1349740 [compost metagenome]